LLSLLGVRDRTDFGNRLFAQLKLLLGDPIEPCEEGILGRLLGASSGRKRQHQSNQDESGSIFIQTLFHKF
jgi:hypothetical protein